MSEAIQKGGAFVASLKRNNRKIRDDRAQSIAEDTQLAYRRRVEDIELNIRRMQRSRENALDLSPSDAHSLVVAKDFDSAKFVEEDLALGVKIRNEEIRLEIAIRQYEFLFGPYTSTNTSIVVESSPEEEKVGE